MRARLASILAAVVLASAGAPALAQDTVEPSDPTREAEAAALFRRGVELGEQDRWADALELFRRSRDIAERPNTLFNIGFALSRLGRFREAVVAFDAYLATSPEESERRTEAMRLRGEAVASLAQLTLVLTPEGALVEVDGEPFEGSGGSRMLSIDPGRHRIVARAERCESAELVVSVLAGEHATQQLALTCASPPIEDPIEDPITGPTPGERSVVEEPAFWIVIASVVVVGAAVGIGVGVALQPGPYNGSSGVVLEALRF